MAEIPALTVTLHTKMERLEAVVALFDKIPNQLWALTILALGGLLCILRHEDAGRSVISGGLMAWQHKSGN